MRRFGAGLMLLAIALAVTACGNGARTQATLDRGRKGAASGSENAITIYRSPTCGCCKEYEAYLEAAGWRVEVFELADMSAKKVALGVPEAAWSCHTSVLGDYIVEGHVPIEIMERLMREKPAIKGLALPDMPPGAPGMGTAKEGPLHVVSFDDAGMIVHYAEF